MKSVPCRIVFKPLFILLLTLVFSAAANAQVAQPTAPAPSANTAATPEMSADLGAYNQLLSQVQDLALRTAADLGTVRVDKWKADSQTKQQYSSNIASLQRNLTAALPEMLQKTKAAPQSVAPSFRLYRNLNVVYDVLASTAESAGAFGPKEQYEPLESDVSALDQLRKSIADRLDWLAGVKDTQLTQTAQQLQTTQTELAAAKKSAEEAAAEKSAAKKTTKSTKKKKPASE